MVPQKAIPAPQLEPTSAPHSMRAFSGVYVDTLNPDVATIFPVDIAVHLSREPRFGGATKKFYSVAEHSVWCALLCEEMYHKDNALPFKVLLHDAHEAYLKDIPSPFKKLLPEYKPLAEKMQDVIHQRFNVRISPTDKERICEIDRLALEWEWKRKVLKWTGLLLDDQSRIDTFIHHFVRLCKTPVVLQP